MNSEPAVEYVTVHGPLAPKGRRYTTVRGARTARDRMDRRYGASCHTYAITYLQPPGALGALSAEELAYAERAYAERTPKTLVLARQGHAEALARVRAMLACDPHRPVPRVIDVDGRPALRYVGSAL